MAIKETFIAVILILIGLIIWIAIGEISNDVETFDSNCYFLIGLPIMFISASIAGYLDPKHPLTWGISIVILQPIALFAQSEIGPFAVVGLIFFLFIAWLTITGAFLGKKLRMCKTKYRLSNSFGSGGV